MVEVVRQILDYLITHYSLYMVITMSAVVSLTIGILAIAKKPIKKLTSLIKNETLRKLSNKVLIFMAFGISALIWVGLNAISKYYFPVDSAKILLTGAFSVVTYALGDGVITTTSAQKIVETITEISENDTENQLEVSQNSKDPIKDFWDKMK